MAPWLDCGGVQVTTARIDPAVRKSVRLTVLFTESEMAALERIAAHYNLSKSAAAHDMIVRTMAEESLPQADVGTLADAEEKQDDWRKRMNL